MDVVDQRRPKSRRIKDVNGYLFSMGKLFSVLAQRKGSKNGVQAGAVKLRRVVVLVQNTGGIRAPAPPLQQPGMHDTPPQRTVTGRAIFLERVVGW